MGKHNLPKKNNHYATKAVGTLGTVAALSLTATAPANALPGVFDAIIKCESGGNPKAKNPRSSASGLFQFIDSTWRAYGGLEFAPTAAQATVAEQYIVAERAYASEGTRPWNASRGCWKGPSLPGTGRVAQEARVKAPETHSDGTSRGSGTPTRQIVPQAVSDPVIPPEAKPGPFTPGDYTIVKGDTLWDIAERQFGDPTRWPELFDGNRDVVEHEDWIWPEEAIDIP